MKQHAYIAVVWLAFTHPAVRNLTHETTVRDRLTHVKAVWVLDRYLRAEETYTNGQKHYTGNVTKEMTLNYSENVARGACLSTVRYENGSQNVSIRNQVLSR